MDAEHLVSVADASAMLRVSERQVRRYCTEGKLACSKDGKAFEISLESVMTLLRQGVSQDTEDMDSDTDADMAPPKKTVTYDVRRDSDVVADVSAPLPSRPVVEEKVADVPQPVSVGRQALADIDRTLSEVGSVMQSRLSSEQVHTSQVLSAFDQVSRLYRLERERTRRTVEVLRRLLADLESPPKRSFWRRLFRRR